MYRYILTESHGKEFTLTKEFFKEHWSKTCYYCGNPIPKVAFDKIDATKGYTPDNVVLCCWVCNRMKGNMSSKDFQEHIRKLAQHLPKAF